MITKVDGEIWKYSRYFDNPRFDEGPGNPDDVFVEGEIPPEFECYNISKDPTEVENRLSPVEQTLSQDLHDHFKKLLREQRRAKRLLPKNLNRDVDVTGPLRT